MIDWTKPIRQKNGRRAAFLCEVTGRILLTLLTQKVAIEEEEPCNWSIAHYTAEGKYWIIAATTYDLENIPEESHDRQPRSADHPPPENPLEAVDM